MNDRDDPFTALNVVDALAVLAGIIATLAVVIMVLVVRLPPISLLRWALLVFAPPAFLVAIRFRLKHQDRWVIAVLWVIAAGIMIAPVYAFVTWFSVMSAPSLGLGVLAVIFDISVGALLARTLWLRRYVNPATESPRGFEVVPHGDAGSTP
jgi:hypothetical protein